jgi:phosphotransferase system  glucose/maltose/N-acetylglucosamine-specific IIC component
MRSLWPRSRALLLVMSALWLPTLLPFVVGPLTECGHCIRNYLCLLPVMPGIGVALFVDGAGGLVLSGIVSLLAVLLLVAWVRERGASATTLAVVGVVGVLSGLQAVGLSYGLRM